MNITKLNYELYIIDYIEGTLDSHTRKSFVSFLKENPDVEEEISLYLSAPVIAEEKTTFPSKNKLYRKNKLPWLVFIVVLLGAAYLLLNLPLQLTSDYVSSPQLQGEKSNPTEVTTLPDLTESSQPKTQNTSSSEENSTHMTQMQNESGTSATQKQNENLKKNAQKQLKIKKNAIYRPDNHSPKPSEKDSMSTESAQSTVAEKDFTKKNQSALDTVNKIPAARPERTIPEPIFIPRAEALEPSRQAFNLEDLLKASEPKATEPMASLQTDHKPNKPFSSILQRFKPNAFEDINDDLETEIVAENLKDITENTSFEDIKNHLLPKTFNK